MKRLMYCMRCSFTTEHTFVGDTKKDETHQGARFKCHCGRTCIVLGEFYDGELLLRTTRWELQKKVKA